MGRSYFSLEEYEKGERRANYLFFDKNAAFGPEKLNYILMHLNNELDNLSVNDYSIEELKKLLLSKFKKTLPDSEQKVDLMKEFSTLSIPEALLIIKLMVELNRLAKKIKVNMRDDKELRTFTYDYHLPVLRDIVYELYRPILKKWSF